MACDLSVIVKNERVFKVTGGHVHFTSGSAMTEGPCDALSVEILQLQNIPFEN